jgi:hypothetical protein
MHMALRKIILGPWTPARLKPALWIEPRRGGMFQSNAGSGTLAAASGDAVGFIPDLSGNGFHLSSVADDTTRPLLQGVGLIPYLDFDGSNDLLQRAASLGIYAAGSASIFMALKANNGSLGGLVMLMESANASDPFIAYIRGPTGGTATTSDMFLRNDASVTLVAAGAVQQTLVFDNVDHVYGVVDTGSSMTTHKDGVAGTAVGYTRSGVVTATRFALGASYRNTTTAFFAHRCYGLVIVKRALSLAEISMLTRYMGRLNNSVN